MTATPSHTSKTYVTEPNPIINSIKVVNEVERSEDERKGKTKICNTHGTLPKVNWPIEEEEIEGEKL